MIHLTDYADDGQKRNESMRNALTLVELLIVIAILSVLTAIALPVTKDLIEENRIKESVRTVQSFMEMARSKAMSSGREHAVEFIQSDPTLGTVFELRLGIGMPSYRGDIEGAFCRIFNDNTTPLTIANCAVFNRSECPTLVQALNGINSSSTVLPNDSLVLDGIELTILSINACDGTETIFSSVLQGMNPDDYLKIYFNPNRIYPPPTLPVGSSWHRTFEIRRKTIREGQTTLTLPRGAAIDLYFSGLGLTGQEFSPLSTGRSSNISIVFSPSGRVSRIQGIPAYPSMLYFLVGKSDQARGDLANLQPTPLPIDDPKNLTNVVDPNATWLMVNAHNGRISTSPVRTPIGGPTSIDQLKHSRSLANQPQEQE